MKIQYHWQLEVYKLSVATAMKLFRESASFPKEEIYSLTDQMRRSPRSVSGQLGEAWRRRKYEAVFIDKLNSAEAEAAETQVWVEYAVKAGYLDRKTGRELHSAYNQIIAKLVVMGNNPRPWLLQRTFQKASQAETT